MECFVENKLIVALTETRCYKFAMAAPFSSFGSHEILAIYVEGFVNLKRLGKVITTGSDLGDGFCISDIDVESRGGGGDEYVLANLLEIFMSSDMAPFCL